MHMPSPCSNGSAPSRLEWRPSRLRALAESGVLVAAPWLITASDLSARWQAPGVLLTWLAGIACLWHELRRPSRLLWLQAAPRPLLLDGVELEAPSLHVRGPWVQLRWQGPDRGGQLLFWPDTLDGRQRRELRLAVRSHAVSRQPPSVAP